MYRPTRCENSGLRVLPASNSGPEAAPESWVPVFIVGLRLQELGYRLHQSSCTTAAFFELWHLCFHIPPPPPLNSSRDFQLNGCRRVEVEVERFATIRPQLRAADCYPPQPPARCHHRRRRAPDPCPSVLGLSKPLFCFRHKPLHRPLRHPLLPDCRRPVPDRHDVGIKRWVGTCPGVLIGKDQGQVEVLATIARRRSRDGCRRPPLITKEAVRHSKDGLPIRHGGFRTGPQQPACAHSKLTKPTKPGDSLLHGLEPLFGHIDVPAYASTQTNTKGFDLFHEPYGDAGLSP